MSVSDVVRRMSQSGVGRRELAELSLHCTTGRLSEADPDDLVSVMEILAARVRVAISKNLLESAKSAYTGAPSKAGAVLDAWIKKGEGREIVDALRYGLEAASIIVFVGALENVDRRALNEEAIHAAISLMQGNLAKHLIPALNNTGHVISTPSGKKRRSNASEGSIPNKDLKKIYKQIAETMTLQLILMDRLTRLIGNLSLDSQQVVHLTAGAIRTLEVDSLSSTAFCSASSVQQLQVAAIMIITAAFRRYPGQRDTTLDEILSIIPCLPTSKRSLRTFPVSYASATCPSALQDCNEEVVSSLLSHQNHTIQMVTSLVLSLVQSCVTRPTFVTSTPKTKESESTYQSGLRTCQGIADAFVAHLLQRCTKTSSGASVDSFRTMLANFTEDLLLVFLVPEYPASKLLLHSLERLLKIQLSQATRVFGHDQKTFETTYLNSAFDVLGKICSVQARVLAVSRKRPVTLTAEQPMSMDTEENDDVSCLCSSTRDDVFLVQCDNCNRVFHGGCIGIADKESVPETWSCDSCCLGRILNRERTKVPSDEQSNIDKSYVLHLTIRSMVSHRFGVEMQDAVRMSLGLWVDAFEKKGPVAYRCIRPLLEYFDKPGPSGETLTEDGTVRVILALAAEDLAIGVRNQIGFILKIMEDPNTPSLRKLSLKVIDNVVKGDQTAMMIPLVAAKVSQRLSDDSISVREAAVALVGEYIAQSPGAVKRYGAALVPCLTDPGVSVRKRAIRIFEQILINSPTYFGRSQVCTTMLERAADPKEEEPVRDLIDELFAKLWLTKDGSVPSSRKRPLTETEIVSIPGVVTPTSPTLKKRTPRKSDVAAEQMMEVVKSAETGMYLEGMIKKLLTGGAIDSDSTRKQTERKKRQEMGLDQCVTLVDALMELLVVLDEQREFRPELGKEIAATLSAVAVFASVCPHQVVKHIDTVQTYLKADNGVSVEEEALIVKEACSLFSRLIAVFDHQSIEKLSNTSIAKDLGKICYRFGGDVIDAALEAFSSLAHHPEGITFFKEKLLNVANVFYEFLLKKTSVEDFTQASPKARSGVFRALTILGHVAQHFSCPLDWTEEVEKEAALIPAKELNWDNLPIASFRMFSVYLKKPGSQCKALAALKGLFLSHPHLLLLLDGGGLFTKVMGDDAGEALQLESLGCWHSILSAEELKVDSGEAAAQMDEDGKVTVSKRVSGDQNGDATVFGSVLNKHSPRLFEMLHNPSQRVRFASLQLLNISLRQGLLNPNEVVPHLFALQGEVGSTDIRDLALQLLTAEGEKRADVIRQRMAAGVKRAFEFQTKVSTETLPSAVILTSKGSLKVYSSIFNTIFEEWIVKQRKLRESIYKSLVRMFDFETLVDSEGIQTPPNIPLLAFVAQVLAHLPYTSPHDPLLIIHQTSHLVTLHGQQIQDDMANTLRQVGLASEDALDSGNTGADSLEKAAKKKFPSRTKEARPMKKSSFDLAGFTALCERGMVVTLLLQLKDFLMRHYNLSTARCLEYDPTSKERPFEKVLAKVVFREAFDTSSFLHRNSNTDTDSLIRHYAEFRQLMRKEHAIGETADEGQSDGETGES